MPPRTRLIYPEAAVDEDIATMSLAARYVWAYLPCHADREGRLKDAPFSIRLAIMPTDQVDMESVIAELAAKRHIIRYEVDGKKYLQIRNFVRYQRPHIREARSMIPPPPGHAEEIHLPDPGTSEGNPWASQGSGKSTGSDTDQDQIRGDLSEFDPGPPRPEHPGKIWNTAWWKHRFGMAWSKKYGNGAITYGMSSDGRAMGALADLLESLPQAEVLDAQAKSEAMFAEFLASTEPRVVRARHPLAFFVADFGGLRVAARDAKSKKSDYPEVK